MGEPPKINPRAAEPPYRQIAAWLRGRIEAGEFRPGEDPLPSEKDLQETFEVSRDTAGQLRLVTAHAVALTSNGPSPSSSRQRSRSRRRRRTVSEPT